MLSAIILKLFETLPRPIQLFLARSKDLRHIRNVALRTKGIPRQITVNVKWNNVVSFKFHAPIKIAEKAKKRGIENTLLRNSLAILSSKQNAIVFDVGANYGFLSTVWARSICRDGGQVFSFEPHPVIFKSIQKTIALNALENIIKASNVAVGEISATINMFLYGTTSNVIARNTGPQSMAQIPQLTLDQFVITNSISHCDLIKIDTDGSELKVLYGAKEIITKSRPFIIVETNNNAEILDFLHQMNYILLDMELKEFDRMNIPANVFAVSGPRR